MNTEKRPIDNVTVDNLGMGLRMCKINIDKLTLDHIIDLVELLEIKGDETSIYDIYKLQELWQRQQ